MPSLRGGASSRSLSRKEITLLNVDYKIASCSIAGRLIKVIHFVVAEDQTCGVPGRFIGDSVSLLRDVAHFTSASGSVVAILSLDREKAFDRIDWSFLRSTLICMGFGPSFISWVDLFYAGVQSAVKVNGFVTPFFCLSRGVRQGCPHSPLLYVLLCGGPSLQHSFEPRHYRSLPSGISDSLACPFSVRG